MIGFNWKFGILCIAAILQSGCDGNSAAPAAPVPARKAATISQEKIQQSLAAAQEYFDAGELPEAIAVLTTVIDRAPSEGRAYEMYGQALTAMAMQAEKRGDRQQGKLLRQQAYQQYKKAVELMPSEAGLQQSAGMMALRAGENQAAIAHFHAAGELDQTNPQYPLFEAQLLIAEKKYDAARASLERVLKIDPDAAVAHASLAMIELDLQNFAAAFRQIAIAREIEPQNVDLRAQHAKIHRRNGEPKRVLELLLGLQPQEQTREVVTFEIAAAYQALNEHLKAAQAWERCFHAQPADIDSWRSAVHAGQSFLKAGMREEASKWLQKARLSAGANQQTPEIIALEAALKQ